MDAEGGIPKAQGAGAEEAQSRARQLGKPKAPSKDLRLLQAVLMGFETVPQGSLWGHQG